MSKVLRSLGWVWAAPLTLFGLAYVLTFSLLGWYTYTGKKDDALVWKVRQEKLPTAMTRFWNGWAGQACGNVVVVKHDIDTDKGRIILRHEQEHVRQCMLLGIFQPLLYGVIWLGLQTCRNAHPYYDHPFEIDARRAAGQVVDVIGALRTALSQGKIKLPGRQ